MFGNITKNECIYMSIFGNVSKNGYATKMTTVCPTDTDYDIIGLRVSNLA